MKNLIKLFVSIAACQLAGVIGSIFTYSSVDTWYAALKKPVFMPPPWVFAPVWMFLYTLMGIAVFLVWREGFRNKKVRDALEVFLLQLFLNAAWSYVFFGLKSAAGGMLVILVMWVAIFWTIMKFDDVSKAASRFLVPYLLWVSFAVVLNGAIVGLNMRI